MGICNYKLKRMLTTELDTLLLHPANGVADETTNMADNLPHVPQQSFSPLPHVVWRRIIHFLSDSLPLLLHLSAMHPDLQEMCRPHTSAHFEVIKMPVPELSSDYFYHHLVRLVLEGHFDASCVLEFRYHYQHKDRPIFVPSPTARPGLPSDSAEQQVQAFDQLVADAVCASHFIAPELELEICTRFRHGDQDAALVILLPLFSRLKVLEPPGNSPLCATLFQSIGKEHQRRGTNALEARRIAREAALRDRTPGAKQKKQENDCLPFSELLILRVSENRYIREPYPLTDLLPFMGLPSLHRIILDAVNNQNYAGWGDNVPCSSPEIYFFEAAVSKAAVHDFALRCNAPCDIRQRFVRPEDDICETDPDEPLWDHVLVKGDNTGSNTVEVRSDYGGGLSGYNHAWISWLFWGKMHQWRRLDEEFSLKEGDGDEIGLWCWAP